MDPTSEGAILNLTKSIENIENNLVNNIDNLQTNQTNLQNNVFNTINNELIPQIQESLNNVQTDINKNTDHINTLQTDVNKNTDHINTLQTDVNKNTDHINTLQNEIVTNAQYINESLEDIVKLKTDVNTLHNEILTNAQFIDESLEGINILQTEIDKNTNNINSLQTDVNSLQTSFDFGCGITANITNSGFIESVNPYISSNILKQPVLINNISDKILTNTLFDSVTSYSAGYLSNAGVSGLSCSVPLDKFVSAKFKLDQTLNYDSSDNMYVTGKVNDNGDYCWVDNTSSTKPYPVLEAKDILILQTLLIIHNYEQNLSLSEELKAPMEWDLDSFGLNINKLYVDFVPDKFFTWGLTDVTGTPYKSPTDRSLGYELPFLTSLITSVKDSSSKVNIYPDPQATGFFGAPGPYLFKLINQGIGAVSHDQLESLLVQYFLDKDTFSSVGPSPYENLLTSLQWGHIIFNQIFDYQCTKLRSPTSPNSIKNITQNSGLNKFLHSINMRLTETEPAMRWTATGGLTSAHPKLITYKDSAFNSNTLLEGGQLDITVAADFNKIYTVAINENINYNYPYYNNDTSTGGARNPYTAMENDELSIYSTSNNPPSGFQYSTAENPTDSNIVRITEDSLNSGGLWFNLTNTINGNTCLINNLHIRTMLALLSSPEQSAYDVNKKNGNNLTNPRNNFFIQTESRWQKITQTQNSGARIGEDAEAERINTAVEYIHNASYTEGEPKFSFVVEGSSYPQFKVDGLKYENTLEILYSKDAFVNNYAIEYLVKTLNNIGLKAVAKETSFSTLVTQYDTTGQEFTGNIETFAYCIGFNLGYSPLCVATFLNTPGRSYPYFLLTFSLLFQSNTDYINETLINIQNIILNTEIYGIPLISKAQYLYYDKNIIKVDKPQWNYPLDSFFYRCSNKDNVTLIQNGVPEDIALTPF